MFGLCGLCDLSLLLMFRFELVVHFYCRQQYIKLLCGFARMNHERERANAWSYLAIGAAIEVHRIEGPGLIESIYSKCFQRECELRSIPVQRELLVPIEYKGYVFEEPLRLDFLVDDVLILEFKVVEEVLPLHKAQLLTYMRLLKKPLGLLINFYELVLKHGITGLTL